MQKRVKNIIIYALTFYLVLECAAILERNKGRLIRRKSGAPSLESVRVDDLGRKGVEYGVWNGIKLNKYGFQDSDDYEKDKKAHSIRIMCLGDSVTFASSTPPYSWPGFLEEILQSRGLDVEAINAAFPGNNYSQIVGRFEAEYVEFKPDIVLIYKGFRSYMTNAKLRAGKRKRGWTFIRKSPFVKSWLLKTPADAHKRVLRRRRDLGVKSLVESVTEENLSRLTEDLRRLIQVCKSNNIALVLAPFPTLANEENKDKFLDEVYAALYYYPTVSVDAYIKGTPMFNAAVREIAVDENIAYVDITKGLEHSKKYFSDNYHLTIEGSKQVAKNYAEALESVILLLQMHKFSKKL